MSTKLPNRATLSAELTWDLGKLYADDQAWEAELAGLAGAEQPLLELRGRLSESAELLAESFALQDALQRRLEKLYTYAHLKKDEDTGNSTYSAMQDRIVGRMTGLGAQLAWWQPEVLAIAPHRLAQFSDAAAMQPWRRALALVVRDRAHTLGASEERLLALAAEPLANPMKSFGMLSNADLVFGQIRTEQGDLVQVTHGNFVRFLENQDRSVRQQAFGVVYDTYGQFRNTFAALLDGNVRKQVFLARARAFPSALHAALHADNVQPAVYNGLLAAVQARLPDFHRYVALRRRRLGLDALDMYDQYVPLVADVELSVSYAQALQWVRAAVAPLGSAYAHAMEQAFQQRWIDVPESHGKRSGAYSSGCYDSPPYILLNWQNNLDSAFTLMHELGHSMHTYLSNQAQPHAYAQYRILVAEVASTTNEMLLLEHLRQTTGNTALRTYLVNKLCDQFKGTVYRQAMFAQFEADIHAMIEQEQPLTADSLAQHYYQLNARYYGAEVDADQRIGLEWARIPHFYYNFYVYKYATGFAAAQVFAQRLLEGTAADRQAYLTFLQAGGSKDPLDLLADAGVDLRDPAVLSNAFDRFAAAVAELDGLLG